MVNKKLTICFFAPGNNPHTHRWCQAMAEKGHKVILIPRSPCNIIQNEYLKNVEIINVDYPDGILGKIPKLKSIFRANRLCNIMKKIRPDIFHIHFMQSGWTTRQLSKANKNTVISVWGADIVKDNKISYFKKVSIRRVLNTADLLCATTYFLRNETKRYLKKDTRIEVVPFGVDLQKFKPYKNIVTTPIIGFVKNLYPKYGPDILIRAMKRILKDIPNAKLLIAGKGPMEGELKRLAGIYGIQDKIDFVGFIPHSKVPEFINELTVMAMPSVYKSETFGVAAIEAQACCVPVVASDIGGIPEAVDDGITGILVKPGDVDSLSDAIIELLKNKTLRYAMGKAGRHFVKSRYDWKENVTKMEELYFKLLH